MEALSRTGRASAGRAQVAIAGSGPVACLLACSLAQDGHPAVLLEHLPKAPDTEDRRLYALSTASLQFLETQGLYSRLGPSCCRVFSDLEISVFREPARVRFAASDLGGFLLGGLVYASDLSRVLARRVSELGIPTQRFDPDELEQTAQGWVIGRGEAACRAALLVVAEGGQSRLRERFRIPVETLDYGEEALTFGLATEHDLGSTPRQVFT
ncbi:protein VisC, partial [mine drainage metagenome]